MATKPTRRMAESIKEIRRQMAANAERGARQVESAQHQRDNGDALGAVRAYAEASEAYGMACGQAIALKELAVGLGDFDLEVWAETEQGGASRRHYEAQRGYEDLLSGPLYRVVADALTGPASR